MRAILSLLVTMVFLLPWTASGQTQRWVDEAHAADWKVVPADGVSAQLEEVREGPETFLRLHYSFDRGGGFVVLRRMLDLDLAANFVLSFDVRAQGPRQNLEIKLLDDAGAAAGGNVWWINRPAYDFSKQWETVTQRRKHFGFAWGPDAKKELREIKAVEFGIASASGGKGVVDLRRIRYEERAVPRQLGDVTVRVNGAEAADPIQVDATHSMEIDLGGPTEIGGVTIETAQARPGPTLLVAVLSPQGESVAQQLVAWEPGAGYRAVFPETECSVLSIRAVGAEEVSLHRPRVRPATWSDTPNHLLAALAEELPRGRLPRWAVGEQNYWTVCGGLGRDEETTISEDGAIELGRAGPTVEPLLIADGRVLTWADATIEQGLTDGTLPLPWVALHFDAAPWVKLRCTLVEDDGRFLAAYEVANSGENLRHAVLLLGVRPFQVLPPTQWLNMTGGFAAIKSLALTADTIEVNSALRARFSHPADGVATISGIAGDIAAAGFDQTRSELSDTGRLQGGLRFPMQLKGGSSERLIMTLGDGPAATELEFDAALERARKRWNAEVTHTRIRLPAALHDIEETIQAQQSYILVNQDGDGTQPGSRTYERSWIRDGALTSVAMLRLGHADFARRFLDWYAAHQYDNGKIPCVVDKRGSDPVDEHDSTGEYLYAVQKYYEFTHDRVFLERHWEHVSRAVGYLHHLIGLRSGKEYQGAEGIRGAMYGLVPESISHEGYSSKPMHSYWDCFFTSRGLHDGVALAIAIGDHSASNKWPLAAAKFDSDLAASIGRAQRIHHVKYVPGCVELGDFDATSTAIGVWPCDFLTQATQRASLDATLDRYLEFFGQRASGTLTWKDYTPYELRLVGVVATERDPEAGLHMLRYFMNDQRPHGWRHWAEVVGRLPREPRFIGDMPHTWCGTEFLNSVLNMLALDGEEDLRVAAGVPWSIFEPTAADPQPHLYAEGLNTRFGALSLEVIRLNAEELEIRANVPRSLGLKRATMQLPPSSRWELTGASATLVTGRDLAKLEAGENVLRLRTRTPY